MRTLASVLDAAIQRSAAEITLESEQPVIYRTARGSEAEQAVLRRTELFDMLAAAVSDEHQVELMLGNAIEFDFEVQRIKRRVRAVPGAEAMVVRVDRKAGANSAASLPDPTDDLMIELEGADIFASPDGFGGLDLDAPPPPARPADRRSSGFAPTLTDPPPQRRTRPPSGPIPTAFESGTWALEDDDETELELELDAHAGTVSMPASEPTPAPASVDAIDLARTDDESLRSARSVQPGRSTRPAPLLQPLGPARTRSEMTALASPEAETRRELAAVGSPDADTHRELNAVSRSTPELAIDIGEGTLVYLLEPGLAEQLVSALQAPALVVDEQIDSVQLASRVRALPTGSILLVQREDPSAWLGWILRRLEEGFRVFLDTRARNLEGARRILLGTAASERAEAWLAAHAQIVVESGESGPRVRPAMPTS
jgi:hypothetical protein